MSLSARDIKNKQATSNIFATQDTKIQPQSSSSRFSNTFYGSDIFGANSKATSESKSISTRDTSQNSNRLSPTYKSTVFTVEAKCETLQNGDRDASASKGKKEKKMSLDIKLESSHNGSSDLFSSGRKQSPAFVPKYNTMTPRERALKQFSSENISGRLIQSSSSSNLISSPKANINIDDPDFAATKRATDLSSSIFSEYQLPKSPNKNLANKKDGSIRPSNAKWIDTSAQRKFVNFSKQSDEFNNDEFAANCRANELKSTIFLSDESLPLHHVKKNSDVNESFSARSNHMTHVDLMDHLNEDIRKKEPFFSDLFGITLYENQGKQSKNPENSIPTNASVRDLEYAKWTPQAKSIEEINPKQRKIDHRVSQLDTDSIKKNARFVKSKELEISPAANVEGVAGVGTEHDPEKYDNRGSPLKKGEKAKALWAKEFKLASIPKSVDDDTLKKLFSGFHVINIESDAELINGSALGSGKVSLRSENPQEIQKLKERLKRFGIFMIPKEEPNRNLKNRYAELTNVKWTDEKLEAEEHRLTTGKFVDAKELRKKDLQSEGEAFRTTSNWKAEWVGKSDTNNESGHKESAKKPQIKQTQSAPENMQKTPRKAFSDARQKAVWKS